MLSKASIADRFGKIYDRLSLALTKANFPPDMRVEHQQVSKKVKRGTAAAVVLATSSFGFIVLAADGVKKIDDGWNTVAYRLRDTKRVEMAEKAVTQFNERTASLYRVLTVALKPATPTIDTIVAAKSDPAKLILLESDRRLRVKQLLLSDDKFKDSATALLQEFDTAGACLNNRTCNSESWHEAMDGAFCGSMRSYGDFVNLQRQRLPTFASDYIAAIATIDCKKILYG